MLHLKALVTDLADDDSPIKARWRRLMPLALLLLAACSGSPSTLDAKGQEASRIANLAWLMFAAAAIVFVVVTVLLLVAILRARRPETTTADADPQDRRAIVGVIIGGAVIPAIVLLALMGLSVWVENANAAPETTPITIEVIGHRWWWEVRYPDQGITTANEMHIPVGQRVTMKVTSADVIHSFWIPQIRSKIDMIPGQTNSFPVQADQAGSYRGECAEYCGQQHAHMAFIVVAENADDYNKWVANQQKPAPAIDPNQQPDIFEGQQAFLGSSCVYCHTIQGTNASGTLGPDLTHIASRSTIGAGILPNTRGNLAGWIINSQAIKPGNLMPPMDLDSSQLQSILAYLETLQ
jgi:cytochrome c oxidase subunit 2